MASLFFSLYLLSAVALAATCNESSSVYNNTISDNTISNWNTTHTTIRSDAWLTPGIPWMNVSRIAPTVTSVSNWNQSSLTYVATSSISGISSPTTTVTVGLEGGLVFSPSSLNASVGTTIAFNFLGLNHTLTQSDLYNPCQSNGGFDTGFAQFNPANISGKFVVEIEVKDKEPRWFYCAQNLGRSHCQAGMVFSLNARGAHSDFMRNALTAVMPSPSTINACTVPPLLGSNNVSTTIGLTSTLSARVGVSSAVFPPIVISKSSKVRPELGMLLALVFV